MILPGWSLLQSVIVLLPSCHAYRTQDRAELERIRRDSTGPMTGVPAAGVARLTRMVRSAFFRLEDLLQKRLCSSIRLRKLSGERASSHSVHATWGARCIFLHRVITDIGIFHGFICSRASPQPLSRERRIHRFWEQLLLPTFEANCEREMRHYSTTVRNLW